MSTIMTDSFHIEEGILKSYEKKEEEITIPEGVHTIGEGAFKACTSLKKVTLPHSLRRIMTGAFKGCRKLIQVNIPEGVTFIGDYAFHRCHGLQKIHLPSSVSEVGNCAFLYCDSLTEVHIPGVCHLGKQVFLNDVLLETLEISRDLQEDCICDVFTGCGKISDISFADGEHFSLPNLVEAAIGELAVPHLVQQIAIDILRMYDFNGHCLNKFLTNIKHAEIPEGITKLAKSCFFDKRGIISVTLPSSLKEIESRAFRNCISLEQVIFKGEDVYIHEDAFKNCTALKTIEMPDGRNFSLQGISGAAVSSEQEVPQLVQTILGQVLGNFRLSGTILLKYLGNESRVVIPEGVTVIAEDAFAGKEEIDRVILPDGLLEIGAGAFRNCVLLQTITFPDTIRKIGPGAFENCVKLIRAPLPDSLEKIEPTTFLHCRVLKEVTFGKKLHTIGEQAFYGCTSLKKIQFPEVLTSIGTMAFYRCSSLQEITVLSGIRHIGSLAFAQSGVKKAHMRADGRRFGTGIFSNCTKLTTLILEEGVCHIPDKLAFGCTSLQQVTLPDSLESVGKNPWEKTPFLESFKQSPSKDQQRILWDGSHLEGVVHLSEQVEIIAGGAFYGNTKITSLFLPETIRWIGKAAFKGCSSLYQVIWSSGIYDIEEEVFSGCSNLSIIQNSPPLRFIGERAFYGCKNLSKLPLEHVDSIEKEAFSGCVNLDFSSIQKPNFIGERALEFVHPSMPEIIGSIVISAEHYSGAVTLPEGITGIAPFAFSRNRSITSICLPESLRQIGAGAFWGCDSLTEISFPAVSCQIGARAFEKCTSLEKISLLADRIGPLAFAYCTSLKSAEISGLSVLEERLFEGCGNLTQFICGADSQITEIKAFCFCGCRQLQDIDLSNAQTIASYAFEDCDGLTQVTFAEEAVLAAHAFEDCGGLTEICISGDHADIILQEYALSGCTALKYVIFCGKTYEFLRYQDIRSESIPETVRMIFYSAFSCFDVEHEELLCGYHGAGRILHIPEGIRQIQADVFRDILMLSEVHIPDSVDHIGARAFHGTAWMERQRSLSPMVIVNHMLLDGSTCKGEVVIPEDIRLICGWAFANGMGIQKIRFLSDKIKVGDFAFRNCIYLTEMEFADHSIVRLEGISDRNRELPPLAAQAVMDRLNCFKTNEEQVLVECTGNISKLLVADGITAIGDHVFQDSNLLTEIILPHTITSIGKNAFSGCKWLKRVCQPRAGAVEGGIKIIQKMAFSGCGALEYIELSDAFTSLGARAFEHCTSLREIVLPEGLEEIPDKAFYRCHSLRQVHFPSTLKRIGREAFAFCKSLSVPALPKDLVIGERAFEGCSGVED